MKYSSARHTSKSSRSVSVKKQHGMKLRSDKKGGLDDLSEIISQRDKFISSLRTQIKRLEAAVAAKDNTIEELLERFEEVLGIAAMHGLDLRLEPAFEICEDPDPENEEQGSPVGPSNSGRMPFGERECEGTITWHMNMDQDADTAGQLFEAPEEQIPQGSREQTVETSRPEIYGFEEASPFNSGMARRRDMYGPEVEDSLGMVRNGTTSPVAADNSHQVVAMELDTAAGDSAIEDPADKSFGIYEDPDAKNLVEEQGSPVGPSSSGRMPLGERECEGTVTWHINMDQDADTADQSFEVPEKQNLQDSGEQGNGDVIMPAATDAGRILFDKPTAKTSRGKKRQHEDEDGDDLSQKKFRD